MVDITKLSKKELEELKLKLDEQYKEVLSKNLKLDMSRGKPSSEQLSLSNGIFSSVDNDYISKDGFDIRNYGILDGLSEAKELFSELLNIPKDRILIGGNSSLSMMYDTIARAYVFGTKGNTPWCKLDKVKFLCPCPGYDRHFAILEEFGIEMIPIELNNDGPDMDTVEKLTENDETIKGIMCVPLYSNPSGICYSDEVVERIAALKTPAKDFTIIWDNAYGIHHIYKEEKLKDIFECAKKYGTEDRIYYFFSTSKITFPGSGVALMASTEKNIEEVKRHLGKRTIGYDKINQFRLVKFFKNADNIKEHMKKLGKILAVKFDIVLDELETEFKGSNILKWNKPNGGYFISINTLNGCAKRTVALAKQAGVILTTAGAAFPYSNDKNDSCIRLAPTYPTAEDLKQAIKVVSLCIKIAAVEKLLNNIEKAY